MTPYITSIERIGRKEGREEGRQEGRDEGRREGRDEGRKESYREMIGEIIKARFGAFPPELGDRLKEIEDMRRLKCLPASASDPM